MFFTTFIILHKEKWLCLLADLNNLSTYSPIIKLNNQEQFLKNKAFLKWLTALEVDTFTIRIPGFEIQNRGHLPIIDERLSKEVNYDMINIQPKKTYDMIIMLRLWSSLVRKKNIKKIMLCLYFFLEMYEYIFFW